jgi:hypothetical protein
MNKSDIPECNIRLEKPKWYAARTQIVDGVKTATVVAAEPTEEEVNLLSQFYQPNVEPLGMQLSSKTRKCINYALLIGTSTSSISAYITWRVTLNKIKAFDAFLWPFLVIAGTSYYYGKRWTK